jgi:hypothetical protein
VVGGHLQAFRVQVEDFRVVGSAEARGVLRHRVQHRLKIRRRSADDAQDIGRGRVLIQRLGQLCLEARALCSLPLERFPKRFDLGSQFSLGDRRHHSAHGADERSSIVRS